MNSTKLVLLLVAAFVVAVFIFYFLPAEKPSAPPRAKPIPADPVRKDLAGVYFQRSWESPGSRFRLEIRSDGRWAMANMLSGWWGTWEERAGKFLFTDEIGPTGRIADPATFTVEFSGGDSVRVRQFVFDRLPPNEKYLIPFDDDEEGSQLGR